MWEEESFNPGLLGLVHRWSVVRFAQIWTDLDRLGQKTWTDLDRLGHSLFPLRVAFSLKSSFSSGWLVVFCGAMSSKKLVDARKQLFSGKEDLDEERLVPRSLADI